MIELTEQQAQALEDSRDASPRLVNPRTNETFVLLRVDEYERLKRVEYDDEPWSKEELQALAWEAGKSSGWEAMDEYDDLPEVHGQTLGKSTALCIEGGRACADS